jgi:L-ascorbate metabolism protein UlaG (beta-lactamase superfamily)
MHARLGLVIVVGCVLFSLTGVAGEEDKPGLINPSLNANDDAFIGRQSGVFLQEADAVLKRVPPALQEPEERKLALYLIDAVLHDTRAPNRPEVQTFYHTRMEETAQSLETTKVTSGLRIWKMYNHGFIARTATVTVAFDLFRGPAQFRWDAPDGRKGIPSPDFPISDELAKRLVQQCDVLFVSHPHDDHADPFVVTTFLEQGKPVIGPENVFQGKPLGEKITHLKREAHTEQTLAIQNGQRNLKVVIYPGQQYQDGGPQNNVSLVITPEGLSFAHNGDQINDPYPAYQEDFKWIDAVREHHRVDVLMTNNWTMDMARMAKGFNPKLVLLGHQNEMGHQMNDRVPYWGDAKFLGLNVDEARAAGYPVLNMAWGESILLVP